MLEGGDPNVMVGVVVISRQRVRVRARLTRTLSLGHSFMESRADVALYLQCLT